MYAVISAGGKQYKVSEKDVIDIERVDGDSGSAITFPDVLAVGEGAKIDIGTPLLDSAKVEATIVEHFRGKKLVAFKMKKRKSYRRKVGHRQELTRVRIEKIASSFVPEADSKADGTETKSPAKKAAESSAKTASGDKPKKKSPAKKAAKD